MKQWKKVVILLIVLIMTGIIIAVFMYNTHQKPSSKIKHSNIEQIGVFNPEKELHLTQQEDVENILTFLDSIEGEKIKPDDVDGFGFIIKIFYKDGTTLDIVLRGNVVVIDSKYYSTSMNYCDKFRAKYNVLKMKG